MILRFDGGIYPFDVRTHHGTLTRVVTAAFFSLTGAFTSLWTICQKALPEGPEFESAVICRRGYGYVNRNPLSTIETALRLPLNRCDMQAEDPAQNVTAQGGVVAGMTLLSRISGFGRDMVLANFFGASEVADAFFVAFRIPNFFRRLFAEGAFNQAFVPVLTRYKARTVAELRLFVAVVAGNLTLALLFVVIAGVVLAPGLVAVFAPGFAGDEQRFALTTDMLRITFPYLGFISLTAFAGALQNSQHRYAIPAFTPVLLNLTLISAMLFAADLFTNPVFALAWGVFAAGLVQLLFQFPSIWRLNLVVAPRVSTRHEGAKQVGRLLVPAVLAASVSQINTLIDTILASTLLTGSISWLYYSDRLMELPIGLVAVALGTVLLPNLSRLDAAGSARNFLPASIGVTSWRVTGFTGCNGVVRACGPADFDNLSARCFDGVGRQDGGTQPAGVFVRSGCTRHG